MGLRYPVQVRLFVMNDSFSKGSLKLTEYTINAYSHSECTVCINGVFRIHKMCQCLVYPGYTECINAFSHSDHTKCICSEYTQFVFTLIIVFHLSKINWALYICMYAPLSVLCADRTK